jgi:hypothetical protein
MWLCSELRRRDPVTSAPKVFRSGLAALKRFAVAACVAALEPSGQRLEAFFVSGRGVDYQTLAEAFLVSCQ